MNDKKELLKAIAGFQQEVPVIHKGTQGYGYSYADLPSVFKVINPLMQNYGLGFTQLVNEDTLKTIVFHIETGQSIESTTKLQQNVSLAKMNEFQVLGSQITYLRRYALSAILGLVTDKDTDAYGIQDKKKALTTIEAGTEIFDKAVNWCIQESKTVEDLKKFYTFNKATEQKLINKLQENF